MGKKRNAAVIAAEIAATRKNLTNTVSDLNKYLKPINMVARGMGLGSSFFVTEEGNLKVELHFNQIDQFEPESIVNQIPRLARLLEARQQLRDLLGKLDGNDELDALLENILQYTEDLKQLKGSTEASDGETAEAAA